MDANAPPPPPPNAPSWTGPVAVPRPMTAHEERSWAMFTHLAGLVSVIGIPSVLGPLVMWLIKKDHSALVDVNGRRALNFHLTMLIGYVIGFVLLIVLVGFLVLIAVAVVSVVFSIIATVQTSNGHDYRYPFSIRFLQEQAPPVPPRFI